MKSISNRLQSGVNKNRMSKLKHPLKLSVHLTKTADSSVTGIFTLARTTKRAFPTKPNEKTNECIHPSVLEQISSYPNLQPVIQAHPELVCKLQALEEQFKAIWEKKYNPESPRALEYAARLVKDHDSGIWTVGSRISRVFSWSLKRKTVVKSEGGKVLSERSNVGGVVVKAGLPVTQTPPPIP